jgi:hypothetical protein
VGNKSSAARFAAATASDFEIQDDKPYAEVSTRSSFITVKINDSDLRLVVDGHASLQPFQRCRNWTHLARFGAGQPGVDVGIHFQALRAEASVLVQGAEHQQGLVDPSTPEQEARRATARQGPQALP